MELYVPVHIRPEMPCTLLLSSTNAIENIKKSLTKLLEVFRKCVENAKVD